MNMRARYRSFNKATKGIIWSDYSVTDGVTETGESIRRYVRDAVLEFLETLEPNNVYGFEYSTDCIVVYYRET